MKLEQCPVGPLGEFPERARVPAASPLTHTRIDAC